MEGYELICDNDGIRIEVTEYHVEPLKISWKTLLAMQGGGIEAAGLHHIRESFPEGYEVDCDDNGIRIEVTDYHAGPLVIPWGRLLEIKNNLPGDR